jgi:hypothetical protein
MGGEKYTWKGFLFFRTKERKKEKRKSGETSKERK